jgi:hypothetical protein
MSDGTRSVWRRWLRPVVTKFVHGLAAPLVAERSRTSSPAWAVPPSRLKAAPRRAFKTLLSECYLVYADEDRLTLPSFTRVNHALFNTVSGRVEVGENVFFGFKCSAIDGHPRLQSPESVA